MTCRNCGAGLEAARIDTSLGVVTCSHCGSLHTIPDESVNRSSDSEPGVPAVKPTLHEVALPSRFKIQRGAGSMEITWPAGGIFHGIVLSIMALAVAHMAQSSGMLILLFVSVAVLYFAAVRGFNKNRLRVDGSRLQVTQGPLPWPGTRKLDSTDITQLYTTEYETRSGTGNNNGRKVQVRKYYRLSANTRSSGRMTVLSGLNDPLQAMWLEQEIERLLGIVDSPVAGEHTL